MKWCQLKNVVSSRYGSHYYYNDLYVVQCYNEYNDKCGRCFIGKEYYIGRGVAQKVEYGGSTKIMCRCEGRCARHEKGSQTPINLVLFPYCQRAMDLTKRFCKQQGFVVPDVYENAIYFDDLGVGAIGQCESVKIAQTIVAEESYCGGVQSGALWVDNRLGVSDRMMTRLLEWQLWNKWDEFSKTLRNSTPKDKKIMYELYGINR